MELQEQSNIAKGKVLAYLLMNKQPASLAIVTIAERLQLTPEQMSEALNDLCDEGKIRLVMTRAIATLCNRPEATPVESDPLEQKDLDAHPDFEGDPPEPTSKRKTTRSAHESS
jgi:hypothetical protein